MANFWIPPLGVDSLFDVKDISEANAYIAHVLIQNETVGLTIHRPLASSPEQ